MIDKNRTKRVLRTLRKHNGKAVMWKVLKPKNCSYYVSKPTGGFQYTHEYILVSPIQGYEYGIGNIFSNRKSNKISNKEKQAGTIGRGIHVYTNKSAALKFKYSWEIVVPVVVRKKDFVSAGEKYDAVFTKVHLVKEDYCKIIELYITTRT